MKSVNFNETNPILFDINCYLEGNEWCSWHKFACHAYNTITDRNSDEGLKTLFEITTQSGNDIGFEDFCQYLKLSTKL